MKVIPYSPTPQPIQLLNWIFRPLDYMDANSQQHGDLFRARGSLFDWVFVSHPDALKALLSDTKTFSAPGDVNRILSSLLGDHSVIMLDGSSHQARRQVIMPPFHGDRLKVYADLIRDLTLQALSELTPGRPFRARTLTQTVSMRVILQAVFGLYEGERYEKLEALLKQRLDMASSPLASTLIFFPWLAKDWGSWSPGARLNALMAETDRLLYAEIRDRRATLDPSRTDILSLLLLARDEAGNGLTDTELRDELMTMLVAGHETTATAIAWSLYWVHRHPEIREKILAEIAEAGVEDDPIGMTKLPYLSAVCNETLRIYPVGMLTFARQATQATELRGFPVEAGDLLVGCIYLLHRREDLYPNAHEFRPERFLERQYSAYEFMPFGAGTRRCVGAALAAYELKVVLATLLTQADMALAHDRPIQAQRRGITLGMKGGVEMVYRGQHHQKTPAMV